jgi:hypothetical protein
MAKKEDWREVYVDPPLRTRNFHTGSSGFTSEILRHVDACQVVKRKGVGWNGTLRGGGLLDAASHP